MTEYARVTLSIPAELLARLDAVAVQEDRNRSSMAAVLIRGGLVGRGKQGTGEPAGDALDKSVAPDAAGPVSLPTSPPEREEGPVARLMRKREEQA